MNLKGEAKIDAPPEQVWDILLDPEVIAACIPGCQELREEGPDRYTAVLKLGLGPVSGTYEGSFHLHDKVAPSRYTMAFEGTGRPGFVKGTARAELRADGGATVVAYECDLEIGGLIASVGQRVLKSASSYLVGQMFAGLRQQVAWRKSA
ncbi:MAG: CoxG family protein [Planctomycetota bacterium]|jgi:carbon monoxide dehydrogenase subunit G